jgi:hypothetical protein
MGSPYGSVTGKEEPSVRTIELLHAIVGCTPTELIFFGRFTG